MAQDNNNVVFVSEYQAPDDIEILTEFNVKLGLQAKEENKNKVEKLFVVL